MTYPKRLLDSNPVSGSVITKKSVDRETLWNLVKNAFEKGFLINNSENLNDIDEVAKEIKKMMDAQGANISKNVTDRYSIIKPFISLKNEIIKHLNNRKVSFFDLFYLVALLENHYCPAQDMSETQDEINPYRLTPPMAASGKLLKNEYEKCYNTEINKELFELLQQYLIYWALDEFISFNKENYYFESLDDNISYELRSFNKYKNSESIYANLKEKIDAENTGETKFKAFQIYMKEHFKNKGIDLDKNNFFQKICHPYSSFKPMIQSLYYYQKFQENWKEQGNMLEANNTYAQAGSANDNWLKSKL